MRDHERAESTSTRTKNVRTPEATSTPSQGLLALQSTAGNAAVVQMLRQAGHAWAQETHQHTAGCGHQQDTQSAPAVQRSAVHDVLRSSGRPMDDVTRTEMESRLGADFSDVRIHDDGAAKASAAEVGARAYTSGTHVVIGQGGSDKHTLAHELTHVIQQRQGPVSGTDNGSGLRVSDPSDRFEQEAETNATRVMRSPAPDQSEGLTAQRSVSPAVNVQPRALPALQRYALPGYSTDVDYPQGALTLTVNGTPGDVGVEMRAWLSQNNLGKGQNPKVQPAWWPPMGTAIGNWFATYMVQGHLLNELLGGSGKNLENLTPLVKQANSQHHAKIEKGLKAAVLQNGEIAEYHVTADFSFHPTAADMNMTAGSQEALDFDNIYRFGIPGKIHAEYTLWDPSGKKKVGGDAWDIWNNNQ
ncbi:eCIS core domain-containing protein [Streptomyces sp. HUAS TT7]|uniref:eCIS core domain-containing protein n=1 Tax=Streptomyces sp. HUAS TT7 TaxID=3447507 RepID=UPI003F659AB9